MKTELNYNPGYYVKSMAGLTLRRIRSSLWCHITPLASLPCCVSSSKADWEMVSSDCAASAVLAALTVKPTGVKEQAARSPVIVDQALT